MEKNIEQNRTTALEAEMEKVEQKEKALIERRKPIIAKLSQEDEEELAQIDLEWDELKELKKQLQNLSYRI